MFEMVRKKLKSCPSQIIEDKAVIIKNNLNRRPRAVSGLDKKSLGYKFLMGLHHETSETMSGATLLPTNVGLYGLKLVILDPFMTSCKAAHVGDNLSRHVMDGS